MQLLAGKGRKWKMKDRMREEIIGYIKRNKVSTTEVADCLGKKGALPGIYPVNSGIHRVGKIKYVYGFLESNWSIHEQIRKVQKGDVVLVDGILVNGRALLGELVAKFLLLYQGAEAVVVRGMVRDANDLIRMGYGVWCEGFTPVGCFNERREETEEVRRYAREQQQFLEGAIAVCDDSGIVVVQQNNITRQFLKKLEQIEEQEDKWFYCIDRLKWDTYDTVCLKKYIEGNG